ncbi:MAG TPA: methyltransferase [Pseudonocardia sp.]|nr:methyltransferase [Pseudonocardia sp.]
MTADPTIDPDTASATGDPAAPDPERLLQLGLAFWGSKALLSAVELGLFTELARGPLSTAELTGRLGLHPRGARDFFDAMVALGMLTRDDDGYHNTPDTDTFLDRSKPSYIGGLFEMANDRLYGFWGSLTEGLRTGSPQNEIKSGGHFFEVLYQDPVQLRLFLQAMTGVSLGSARRIAVEFPWHRYRTVIDIGCAQGCLPVQLASRHAHLTGGGFDLPPVAPVFDEYVQAAGLADRLQFHPGDFFTDPLPSADVLVMGHILHDWGLPEKKALVQKAYAALPDGGALIIYDGVIDDQRRANAFGLLMSLNMLIETADGFDYTGADCRGWLDDAGFHSSYVKALSGPDSMIVGIK